MWKKLCSLGCIILLLAIQPVGIGKSGSAEGAVICSPDLLKDAFVETGCIPVKVNVHGWAKTDKPIIPLDKIMENVKMAADFFELENDYKIVQKRNEHFTKIQVEGLNKDGCQVNLLFCSSVVTDATGTREGYISIDIEGDGNSHDHRVLKQKIYTFLQGFHSSPKTFVTFIGAFMGKLNTSKIHELIGCLFKRMGAKVTGGIEDNGLISRTGYSPLLSESLKTGKNLINVNAAMRYNDYENKTYLWVATPVITIEY